MTQFQDYRDWSGQWEGTYDGRPALLQIASALRSDNQRARLSLTYQEGSGIWVSEDNADFDIRSHEVMNQWLRPSFAGGPRLEWPRLLLHTWDINFISGISRWEGRDYGFWFQRRGSSGRINFENSGRFTTWYNLDGRGDHPHTTGIGWSGPPLPELGLNDGRPAHLAINVSPAGPTPRNDVHVDFRFIDVGGRWWRGWKVIRPWEFWVDDLELNPYRHGIDSPGTGTIRWPRFYLHAWKVAHASGWSEWNGRNYGTLFKNGSAGWWT